MKNPGGRPTDYREDYCELIIEFFSVPHVTGMGKNRVPAELPQFTAFARSIGVSRQTLHEWCGVHSTFSDAYNTAKQLQEELIANNAMNNRYNPYFAQFMLKNNHGWKDRTEVDQTNKNIEIKVDKEDTLL